MSSPGLASLAIDHAAVTLARRVGCTACIFVAAVGASALLYSLPIRFAIPLAASLIVSLSWQTWRLGFIGSRFRVTSIRCLHDGDWQVLQRDGWQAATLRPESRVWRSVLWLRWHTDDSVVWVLLIRAATPPAAWRQLQARLRLPNAAQNTEQANAASPTA